MLLFNDRDNTSKNELVIIAIMVFAVWLKLFAVDFKIATVLNWPVMGSMDFSVLRYAMRALAVGLPSLCAILCVMLPISLLPSRVRFALLYVCCVLFSILAVTDTLFIRYYTDVFTFHDILLLPQTGLIAKSIWSLLKFRDLFFILDVVIFPLILYWKKIKPNFRLVTGKRVKLTAALILCAVLVQFGCVANLVHYRPAIMNAMYDRLSVCAWVSTGTFHWVDILKLARKAVASDNVQQKQIDVMKSWFAARSRVSHAPYAEGRNLVILQCEALQYFVVGLKIDGQEVTPNLNRFSRECLYFTNAWNQTAGGLSSDSEFMANTGMFPADFGAAYTRFANNTYNSLAWALRRQKGYHTVVVQGTYSAFWNCHRMHPKLGFEKQYSRNTFPDDDAIGLGLSDKAIFTRALDVFKKFGREPFYGFIVTLSSHHPFDFDGLDDGSLKLPKELKGTLIGNYLIAIHYYDKQLGMFIDGMRRSGLLDRTLIVLYGDHPAIPIAYKEEIEKLLGGNMDDMGVWISTRRVPLLFRIPGRVKGKTLLAGKNNADTGQMDVLPTIKNLLGIKIDTVFGKDLLAGNAGRPVVFRKGTYIIDGVYVDPGAERIIKLGEREPRDRAYYNKLANDAERMLGYNDLILDNNLIKDIVSR